MSSFEMAVDAGQACYAHHGKWLSDKSCVNLDLSMFIHAAKESYSFESMALFLF